MTLSSISTVDADPEQPPLWVVRFDIPRHYADYMSEALAECTVALTALEGSNPERWLMEALCDHEPDREIWKKRLHTLTAPLGIEAPVIGITPLEQKNWIEETQRRFPPFSIGSFFIHGSHVTEGIPADQLIIQLDAGLAFGSGEHATTAGCLMLLEKLQQRGFKPESVLDMGCGSAILAIAVARLWPDMTDSAIIAADIDATSVSVASDNARINQVERSIHLVESSGFSHTDIQAKAPYDVIVANILMTPLIGMAGDIQHHLAADGAVILSGILMSQCDEVIAAYADNGLKLQERLDKDGWSSLLLHHKEAGHD